MAPRALLATFLPVQQSFVLQLFRLTWETSKRRRMRLIHFRI